MGFIASAIEKRATMGPSVHPSRLDDPRVLFGNGYADDATGLNIGETEVLGWPAVMQALRIISWSIGMLPCHLYEKEGEGKKKLRQADEHPVHWLLHDEPHPDYTPFEFNSAMVFSALLRGNGYAQIMRDNGGVPRQLFPMDAARMTVNRVNGNVGYVYHMGGERKAFTSNQILHIKGFSDGGLIGFALNQVSRTSLAKGVAMDRYGARVFKNGLASGAYTEMTDPTAKFKDEDERDRFYNKLQDRLRGQDNWHKVIGLPYGMTLKSLGISPKDAQLIEGLTFQVQDISRLTGVPPSLLMELSRATFSNVEQQLLQFVQLCLGPWIVNIEQRYKKSLLTMEDRKRYVIKFLVDALLRTDLKTQNDALRVAVGQPWMSVNEARDLKELAPIDGGDEVARPMNMDNPGGNPDTSNPDQNKPHPENGPTPPQDGDSTTRAAVMKAEYRNAGRTGYAAAPRYLELRSSGATRRTLRAAYRKTLTRDAGRLVKAELRELRRMMDKAGIVKASEARADGEAFSKSVEQWFQGLGFSAALARTLEPVMRDYADAMAQAAAAQAGKDPGDVSGFIDAYMRAFAQRIAGSHMGQIQQIVRDTDPAALYDALEQRFTEWDEGREDGERMSQGQKIGTSEAVRLGEAVASAAWKVAGVATLVWLASSEACPICNEIDGKVVGIDESFVESSDEIDPADDQVPALKPSTNITNPPIHMGCECDIAPG